MRVISTLDYVLTRGAGCNMLRWHGLKWLFDVKQSSQLLKRHPSHSCWEWALMLLLDIYSDQPGLAAWTSLILLHCCQCTELKANTCHNFMRGAHIGDKSSECHTVQVCVQPGSLHFFFYSDNVPRIIINLQRIVFKEACSHLWGYVCLHRLEISVQKIRHDRCNGCSFEMKGFAQWSWKGVGVHV